MRIAIGGFQPASGSSWRRRNQHLPFSLSFSLSLSLSLIYKSTCLPSLSMPSMNSGPKLTNGPGSDFMRKGTESSGIGWRAIIRCAPLKDTPNTSRACNSMTPKSFRDLQTAPSSKDLAHFHHHHNSFYFLWVYLLTPSFLSLCRIWDLRTNTQALLTLAGHEGTVRCLQFDQTRVVSGSNDSTIRIWTMSNGECVGILRGYNFNLFSSFFFLE